MAEIFIIQSTENPVHLHVNGRSAVIWTGEDTTIDDALLPALQGSVDIVWRHVGEVGPEAEQEPFFDADAIIAGTVDQVAERLGDLTNEQLLSVLDAEDDREVSRKGVREAVEKIITTRNDAA